MMIKHHILHYRILIVFTFLLVTLHLRGQSSMPEWEDSLKSLTDSLMLAEDLSARKSAFDKMVPVLTEALQTEGSFDYPFDSLIRISIQYPPDSSFRIFTGQLYQDEDHYQYYGLIQKRSPGNELIALRDEMGIQNQDAYELLGPKDWMGAIYYGITQFSQDGQTHYVAFGYDGYSMFEDRKIAEVLSFGDNGLTFGKPIFYREEGNRAMSRLLLQYSADVRIRLTYDKDLQMIIFDNLIPMRSPYERSRMVMVPDGSYHGYQQDETGQFVHIEKVFNQTVDAAPRDAGVLEGQKGVDLFGRKNQ